MAQTSVWDTVILFTDYYFGTKAEAVLSPRFNVKLIPTPPALHNACGLCLLLERSSLKDACQKLADEKISYSGVYEYLRPQVERPKIVMK